MKTIKHLIITASVSTLFMSSALALPAWKDGQPLETIQKKSDVENLGPKPQLVLVCKASNTVTLIEIKDEKQAKEVCSEGKMMECKDFKKNYKVIWKNPTGKTGSPELKMNIVNAKGEPCMFLAKLK